MFLILAFIAALWLFNIPIFLDYDASKFARIAWWPPCFVSAVAAWYLADFCDRMRDAPDSSTTLGRMFLRFGTKHSVFWVPVRVWTFVFVGLGAWHLAARSGLLRT
jgi:hypothetical protein